MPKQVNALFAEDLIGELASLHAQREHGVHTSYAGGYRTPPSDPQAGASAADGQFHAAALDEAHRRALADIVTARGR